MKKKLILLNVIVAMFFISCCRSSEVPVDISEVFPRDVSIEKAEEILGTKIPEPNYLPEGYEVNKIMLKNNNTVSFSISNSEDSEIELEIVWYEEEGIPFKIVPPTIDINGNNSASFIESNKENKLRWNWSPEPSKHGFFILTISAPKDLPIAELILIARFIDWD